MLAGLVRDGLATARLQTVREIGISPMKQLVISVHGIRTFGGWQERLEHLLRIHGTDRQLTVINYKFGYFSVLAFIIPFFRWLVVRRFRRFFVETAKIQQWDRIDLVGHSFGTHIIAWGLHSIDSAERPAVNTIVFAGSILKNSFPWQELIGSCVKRLVNDCGVRDKVLVLNQMVVLFTGMAGRLGFNGGTGETFRNRFFNCGHSGFFLTDGRSDDAFMQRYWVPILLTDAPIELVDMRSPSVLGGVKLFLLNNADPIKITVLVSFLVLVIIRIYGLYENAKIQSDRAEANFKRAEANFTIAHSLLSDHLEVISERAEALAEIDTVTELLNRTIGLIERPPYGDDARIALDRALAFVTLAEISFERGEVDRTRDLAIKAIGALAGVPQNDNSALDAQHLMARSERLIGQAYRGSTEPDQKKALDYYDKALSRLEPLEKRFDGTATSGSQWRWLRTLALLQQNKGDLLLDNGQIEEADQQYRTSLATFKKLYRLRTMDPEIVYEMAWVANKFGDALVAQGKDDQALSQIKEAREGIKHLGEPQLSKHPRFRYRLSIVENHIGLVLRNQQHYAEAIESFKEAKTEIGRALEHDPNQIRWLSVLSWTNDNLGETRVRWARAQKNPKLLETAASELKDALATKEKLVKNAPKFKRWQDEPTITLVNIQALNGTEKELMGDCLGAAIDFRYAAARNPEVKDDREDDMVLRTVEFREWSGLAFRNSGKRDDAERELNTALEQIRQYTPRFIAKRGTFTAIERRLEQELQESAWSQPGACLN